MLAAMICPEPGKGGRGKVAESAKFPVHPETLSQARAVLTFSRPLAKAVRDGFTYGALGVGGLKTGIGAAPLRRARYSEPPAVLSNLRIASSSARRSRSKSVLEKCSESRARAKSYPRCRPAGSSRGNCDIALTITE
jgi:hypothetical protein